ncbi:hypothetical protein [Streptosporangium vulgare]|uniref:hypothetical protein n=1 Tax=Streptosporangium vulgare TaxID=46190 RepID=UPI0031CE8885
MNRALDLLLEEIEGVMEPLEGSAHDRDLWESWDRGHIGRRWDDAPFLWAESYFYRKLLSAVGYFGPGAWQGVDPFEPFKQAELSGEAVDEELRELDALAALPPRRAGPDADPAGAVGEPGRPRVPGRGRS